MIEKVVMKVGIYVRVSTDKQEVDNQLLQLRDYCKKNDYIIVKEYSEVVSGAKANRPQFDLMFREAHQKMFDLVLFWDLSRFSRSGTLFTMQKLQELDNLSIKWHSYQEAHFSSLGQFKDIVIAIMATLAKVEREKISERTKDLLELGKLGVSLVDLRKTQVFIESIVMCLNVGLELGLMNRSVKSIKDYQNCMQEMVGARYILQNNSIYILVSII